MKLFGVWFRHWDVVHFQTKLNQINVDLFLSAPEANASNGYPRAWVAVVQVRKDLGRYIRLPGKGNSNSHGARPVHQKHLRHDEVDPDQ